MGGGPGGGRWKNLGAGDAHSEAGTEQAKTEKLLKTKEGIQKRSETGFNRRFAFKRKFAGQPAPSEGVGTSENRRGAASSKRRPDARKGTLLGI